MPQSSPWHGLVSDLWQTQAPKHVQMTGVVCACSLAPLCHVLAPPGGLQGRQHPVKSRVRQTSMSKSVCSPPALGHGQSDLQSRQYTATFRAVVRRLTIVCPVCLQPTTTLAWSRPSRWLVMQHPARPMGPASSTTSLQPGGSCRMQPAYACGQIWRPCRYPPLPCAAFLCTGASACEHG